MKLTVGAAQIFVTPDIDQNYRKIVTYIKKAALKKVDLVAFPECALSGYGPLDHDSPDDVDFLLLKGRLTDLKKVIAQHQIMVVLGTATVKQKQVYNSALLFNRSGKVQGEYHKLHLFPGDKVFYQPGNSLPLFRIQRQLIGLQICFDIRFPESWQTLALNGARLVIHISNACKRDTWKIPVWEGHLRSRAAENGIFVLSVNAAGPQQMGISQIIDPDGLVMSRTRKDATGLVTAQLDMSRAQHLFLKQRRIDIYG